MPDFHENPDHNRYFVSYAHQNGFGFIDATLPTAIRNGHDLNKLCDDIERNRGLRGVAILNFRRFDSD